MIVTRRLHPFFAAFEHTLSHMPIIILRSLLLTGLVLLAAAPAQALQPTQHAAVALIADHATVAPGQTFGAGLRIVHEPGWHSYWQNPGDSGLPTRFDWTLPEGARAGPIQWPVPERLPFGGLVNLGYKNDLLLPATLTVPADAMPGSRFAVTLRARWLICADICIPDQAMLTLDLPVAATPQPSVEAGRFAAALARVPQPAPAWGGLTRRSEAGIEVAIEGAAAALTGMARIDVFPLSPQVVANTVIDAAFDASGVLRFVQPLSDFYAGMPSEVVWVLVGHAADGGLHAHTLRTVGEDPLGPPPEPAVQSAPPPVASAVAVPVIERPLGLGLVLLFALLGGILLNLMPCVFPVLAFKGLAIAQGGPSQHRHALLYTAGILVAFLALAGLLVALRATGEALGWGFQLQTPWFVAAMALLMAGVGFALSGLATPGASLMGFGQSLTESDGDRGAFFTGVLAVVVASPCTAPFMGPALGVALTQPGAVTFGVFVALGVGLALPMLALAFSPALARSLPRPGPWMERLKQALAFPMYFTALWLAYVLGRQVGVFGMTLLLGGIVLMGFALWWRGSAPGVAKRIAVSALLLLAVAPVVLVEGLRSGSPTAAAATVGVEAWSPERVAALRAEGRPVLVNFTAAWCISCIANEGVALRGERFETLLRETGTRYLKADWTDHDPTITAALAEFGRSGVPLYVVYPADGGAPFVLPQLLTPGIVAAALQRAAAAGI
ncbi:protein-disulfide reductase DsbD domain-containing protein [Silanimonas sp.]|uniref:protein-disulfide reductase DsbD family protein n=1 Tax=Silanimonas sp. TaxID=1929290 RepID=UPI001BBD6BA3|nr:protein-disulfide reductase DsbD domain-containing protein [Silanimonas sp.]MBS3895891.1 thioredoxin family protein [Silanimonas sp.]MBS3924605.1 thioredoxin family protein [Xanthomonadaceae bacterium]